MQTTNGSLLPTRDIDSLSIVLRAGYGIEARITRNTRNSPWTHCGIVIGDAVYESAPAKGEPGKDGDSQPSGVRRVAWHYFTAPVRCQQHYVMPLELNSWQQEQVVTFCDHHARVRTPFAIDYRQNDNAFYCTTFVASALLAANINLLANKTLHWVHVPLLLEPGRYIAFPEDLL